MKPNQTSDFPLTRRWREPRLLILVAGATLIVVATALALFQTPTVAAPPPPLRGPFRFIELPDEANASAASGSLTWAPYYTQTFTFGGDFAGWTITRSTELYAPPAPHKWGRVRYNYYPGENFTSTLWAAADPYPDLPVDWNVYADSTYTTTMDTWAIYALDTLHFGHFRAKFDYWLDTEPGAHFGWAFSCDGTNFYGKSASSAHVRRWLPMEYELASCPGGGSTPAYLAFFFQSSNTETPIGLGVFVDNLIISGAPWYKVYMPLIRKDPTPTPTATPTAPPYVQTKRYTFEDGDSTNNEWCVPGGDTDNWVAGRKQLGGSNSYYLRLKQPSWMVLQSPRFTIETDSKPNYRIAAQFNMLGMNSSLNLADYGNAEIGVVFSVWGARTFPPDDKCAWSQKAEDGGYYKFRLKINDNGSGYRARIIRIEKETEQQQSPGVDVALDAISRTQWNDLWIDRVGNTLTVYITKPGSAPNKVLEWATDGTELRGGWFGVYTEVTGKNLNGVFEGNWDNIATYQLP